MHKENSEEKNGSVLSTIAILVLAWLIVVCIFPIPSSAITPEELKYSCLGPSYSNTTIINSTINGTGPQGPAGTIVINATFTGDPGTNAIVTNIGTSYAAILNFIIPKGDTGTQGVNGTPGEPGPQGINGTPGLDGLNGTNASIAVNHTFQLQPGENANVTNIGNESSALLNFYIPQGMMNQTPNMTSSFIGSTWYDHNITSPDVAGYLIFNRSYPSDGEGSASASAAVPGTEYLIKSFVTNPGDPGLTVLPAGDRVWTTFAKTSSIAGGVSQIVIRLYKRDISGTEIEMYNGTTNPLSETVETIVTTITTPYDIQMDDTDRFVVKYYAKTTSAANPAITLYYDGGVYMSHATSPIVQGLQGPPGQAGTIAVNATFTGDPGTAANVTNVGNETAARFDFTIPGGSGTVNMSSIYPIGSVYITVVNESPSVLLGFGTWVKISQGRVLMGQDDNSTYLNVSESIGGNFTQNISAHVWG